MSKKNPPWNRDELILSLDLYFRHNPSHISKTHPEVIKLSDVLNKLSEHTEKPDAQKFRNPTGVYMKLCNFLRFDPNYKGVGLRRGGKLEKEIWDEFSGDKERLREVSEDIIQGLEAPVSGGMQGQVFTIAKIHYINGVVYFVGQRGKTNLQSLADNFRDTTKSGNVMHPLVRVRMLARLAEGIGLIVLAKGKEVTLTDIGKRYYEARAEDTWTLSETQKQILRNHILSDYYRTETIYAITSLFMLLKSGYKGKELSRRFAVEIGKDKAWKSDVTYKGFTQFGLNYINEIGLLEVDDKELLIQDIEKERDYQEKVNLVEPISIPEGKLPPPKPRILGKAKKYVSNPRRAKNALISAEFMCEMNAGHITFINKKSQKQYMESHHLIPMQMQGSFEHDIDVPENILSLCPNCHRKIHLAYDKARKEILLDAYEKKKHFLPQRGIHVEFNVLMKMYGLIR